MDRAVFHPDLLHTFKPDVDGSVVTWLKFQAKKFPTD